MLLKCLICAFALVLINTGCYAEITGKVIDAETGLPIEGAIVLVEWTVTKGLPGMTYHESYKVAEIVTDNEGKVTISGVSNLLINPPDVTVYKNGYVAWNSNFIFPGYKKRADFKWQNGAVFKLEKFKAQYSFIEHQSFIGEAAHIGLSPDKKQLFLRVYNEGERDKVIKERQRRTN